MELRTIALLDTVSNGSHASMRLKTLNNSRVLDLFDVVIDTISQFTVLDTTNVARKISKLSEDSVQTDCSMQTLNLCLTYAMGMREHIETVRMLDKKSGGAFPKGAVFIKKLPAINNFFNTPQRVARVTKIQLQYGLPELATRILV
ncbi:hypothetical protein PHMEG_00017169 [Phytophthora megakarya]|uniref:Uncharacterized protein n=1 Tax=Phytophthora megakarya TaxID=4795 RepID=A0A225VX95_9STRA|nr:hypothetical protein PHMEG_00017169 [Phytophthora megakarya]